VEIPGFDIYAFPNNKNVLYVVKVYELRIVGNKIDVVVEMFIHKGCGPVFLKQGGAKNPQFLIKNSTEGLLKPIGTGIAKKVRDVLVSRPVGDILTGCDEAIADLTNLFGSIPISTFPVNIRMPVVLVESIEYESKLGSRKSVKRGVFEMKPQNFGYIITTEQGLKRMLTKMEKAIRALEQS